jgi:hypothetical protein
MVMRSPAWAFGLILTWLTACGPGLRDGAYAGDPRFTLAGTIENISPDPNQSAQSLRVTVLWQMVAPPAPANTSGEPTPETGTASAPSSTQNPNGASAPTTPQQPTAPTISGQQGGAVSVAFPAPVSLVLYDTPLIAPNNVVPWQAEGTVVIYYDINGDGEYDSKSEIIAATLQDYRLLYTSEASAANESYVDSILDNPDATQLQFTLATRRCDGLVEHLAGASNTHVSLTPGAPTDCTTP